jgi:hypothetical protein
MDERAPADGIRYHPQDAAERDLSSEVRRQAQWAIDSIA